MKPKRGEVWWGEEPERKRRPYLVLTRNSEGDGMPVTCAALDAATEC